MGKYGGGGGARASGARPMRNDTQTRDARHNVEQEGGFDWTPVVLLGVMGATALFSFDRAYQKYEKEKEEIEELEKKRDGDDNNGDDEKRRRRRRREEERDRRGTRRGVSEERRGRGRSMDEWRGEKREVDENGFYVSRRRGRSRGGYDRYDRYDDRGYNRGYDRGYSVDYY